MRQISTILGLLVLATTLSAQNGKRALTHQDYAGWKSLGQPQISRDGHWVALTIRPQVGDPELILRRSEQDTVYRYHLGSGPRFTQDGRFVVFRINVPRKVRRAEELAGIKRRKKAREGGGARGRRGQRGGSRPGRQQRGKPQERDDKEPPKAQAGLGIMDLRDGSVRVIKRVKSFQVPSEGPSFAVWQLEKPRPAGKGGARRGAGKRPGAKAKAKAKKGAKKGPKRRPGRAGAARKPGPGAPSQQAKKNKKKKLEKKPRKYLADGTILVIRNLISGKQQRVTGVVTFGITKKRGILYYTRSSKKDNPKIKRGLFARKLASGKTYELVRGGADFRGFSTDREVTRFVFVTNRADRDAKHPTYQLHHWDLQSPRAQVLVSHRKTPGFPKGYGVKGGSSAPAGASGRRRGRGRRGFGAGRGSSLSFSRDGQVLKFGIAELPKADLPDLLPEDKVTLDIWSWKDPLMQPMQAKQAGRMRSASLACAWHFDTGRMTVLAHDPQESVRFLTDDGSRALVVDSQPYAQEISWDGRYQDVYIANTQNGSRRRVLKHSASSPQASPSGRYLTWFDKNQWYCLDQIEGGVQNLTADIPVAFQREDWDTPSPARAYGLAGWTTGEGAVLLYDRYDIWKVAPDGSLATCLTDQYGRANKLRFRHVTLDPEERWVPTNRPILLATTNLETMASGYFTEQVDKLAQPRRLVMLDKAFGRLSKGKDSERLFFTLTRFEEFGDLWTSAADFSGMQRLSDINPQQSLFRWGKAELVRWHSADGIPLKGILIKPDGFDPKKKYPMMVYFYEKLSSGLHRYHAPAPGTSPNASYYVSNGYLWFMPDIVYRDGYPGESCVKCVVSGVQSLIETGFVEEHAIGAAGHSWGGYQTAFLVTRSNIFKAVESGAPVSNMTSAYGGIRWGSGMSRAFQYERTQSRIGGSLWMYPMRYLENSPLFTADKVETPVLMIHNDKDTAVPWYQGIEYFSALRRLHKEAYLFDYNGEPHGLRRRANQLDWTMRMQQYFDHHLRGTPAPRWMTEGVPYVDREREKLEFNPPKKPVRPRPATPAPPVGGG